MILSGSSFWKSASIGGKVTSYRWPPSVWVHNGWTGGAESRWEGGGARLALCEQFDGPEGSVPVGLHAR